MRGRREVIETRNQRKDTTKKLTLCSVLLLVAFIVFRAPQSELTSFIRA